MNTFVSTLVLATLVWMGIVVVHNLRMFPVRRDFRCRERRAMAVSVLACFAGTLYLGYTLATIMGYRSTDPLRDAIPTCAVLGLCSWAIYLWQNAAIHSIAQRRSP